MIRFAEQCGGGADQDDGRGFAGYFRQVPKKGPARQEDTGQIGLQGLVPLGQRHFVERHGPGVPDARVGDDGVNLREPAQDGREHAVDLPLIPQVRLHGQARHVQFATNSLHGVGIPAVVQGQ